jgi:hypothetical protein
MTLQRHALAERVQNAAEARFVDQIGRYGAVAHARAGICMAGQPSEIPAATDARAAGTARHSLTPKGRAATWKTRGGPSSRMSYQHDEHRRSGFAPQHLS